MLKDPAKVAYEMGNRPRTGFANYREAAALLDDELKRVMARRDQPMPSSLAVICFISPIHHKVLPPVLP